MATSLSQLTLRDLMDAGLHFGHQTKRWNPKMKKYIYDKRNGVHIIDITQSLDLLDQALAFAKKVAEDGGKILFVGTKKQAQEVVKTAAEECGAFYMTNRWLGGTLTNAQTIRKSVRRMRQLQKLEAENGGVLSPHKKEAASLRRELDKLQQNLVGVADMDRLPAAVYVVDVVREKNAVLEATRLGIPVIAIVDTNADPDPIAYPVPGNDDSIRAIKLVSDSIAKIVKEGADAYERKAAEESGSPYMTNRWLGGTLTNAQTIRKSVRRMRQLETMEKNNGGVLSPHKKEAASLRRELDKLRQNLVGVASMDRLPAAEKVFHGRGQEEDHRQEDREAAGRQHLPEHLPGEDRLTAAYGRFLHGIGKGRFPGEGEGAEGVAHFVGGDETDQVAHQLLVKFNLAGARIHGAGLDLVPVVDQGHHVVVPADMAFQDFAGTRVMDVRTVGVGRVEAR